MLDMHGGRKGSRNMYSQDRILVTVKCKELKTTELQENQENHAIYVLEQQCKHHDENRL